MSWAQIRPRSRARVIQARRTVRSSKWRGRARRDSLLRLACAFRPKRSGSMRIAVAPRRHITDLAAIPMERTLKHSPELSRGSPRTPPRKRSSSAGRLRMASVCSTCLAMCGSGSMTGTQVPTTPLAPHPIRPVPRLAHSVLRAVDRSWIPRATSVGRIGTVSYRPRASTTAASVSRADI